MLYQSLPTPHNRAYRPWPRVQPPSALRRYGSTGGPYAVRTGALLPPTNSTKSTLATHWRSESLPQACKPVMRLLAYVRAACLLAAPAPQPRALHHAPSAVTSPINQYSPGAWRLPMHHGAEARPLLRNISAGAWRPRCRRLSREAIVPSLTPDWKVECG